MLTVFAFVFALSSTIPHSLYDPATSPGNEICLFTKDPPQPADYDASSGVPLVNPIKTLLQEKPVAGITKVLSIAKLRKNYHQFDERRRLLSSYSLFLTDERIMPLLPALLGAKFYEKKRQPVAVNLSQHNIAAELTRARDSTYMFISTGASLMVRISRSSFSRQQTFENINAALSQIAANVPKHWAGVQSLHVKTHDSVALPIYNSAHSLDQLRNDPEPTPAQLKQAKSAKKSNAAAASGKKPIKVARRPLASRKERETPPSAKTIEKKAAAAVAATAAPAVAAPAKRE